MSEDSMNLNQESLKELFVLTLMEDLLLGQVL